MTHNPPDPRTPDPRTPAACGFALNPRHPRHPRYPRYPRHALCGFADELTRPSHTAATGGYYMPPQWHRQSRVWVAPPHNNETWPGKTLAEAQREFDTLIAAMKPCVEVMVCSDHAIATDDSWVRDYGPIFVINRSNNTLACHDFVFNSWGGKYDPYHHDDVVPQHIARMTDLPIWVHDFVLEGGSIDVNGRGVVMTTRQCLLNPNRNPQCSQQQIEQKLRETLGIKHVLWLPGGIEGDDTDGHIDDVARFVTADTIVAVRAPKGHPDFDATNANWHTLQSSEFHQFNIIALPVPQPMYHNYPAGRFSPAWRGMLPASYANFLICNGALFMPAFGQPSDDVAAHTLDNAMPNHTIIPVRCNHLIIGQGAIHCMTMSQPTV